MGYTLSRHGDSFQFVFPTPLLPSTPCGWQVAVPFTAATAGLFVTLRFSSFAIPCPGGETCAPILLWTVTVVLVPPEAGGFHCRAGPVAALCVW